MAKGKLLGYSHAIENPRGLNSWSKVYKSLNECRKAARSYGIAPVYKVYDEYVSQGSSVYQKKVLVGEVTGHNDDKMWMVVNKDTKRKNRYVLKKDGTLGSRIPENQVIIGGKHYIVGKWGNLIDVKGRGE